MPNINRQIAVEAFCSPTEGATFRRGKIRKPGPGEILVRTTFAPINPADLNVIEGKYGTLPDLPAVIGNEGTGEVIGLGTDCEEFSPGDKVIYVGRNDCWQDYVTAKISQVIKVPKKLPSQLSSMLKINPATAWLLLNQTESIEPKCWIVQNAANSGVGLAVIAIAKAKGLKTINFVRRERLKLKLQEAGGDIVVIDDENGKTEALNKIGQDPVRLAINAVGGESSLRIMSLLSAGGTHITYGAMAKRPLKIPNSFLIFKDLRIRGLWLTKWLNSTNRNVIESVYAELARMMQNNSLYQPVDSIFQPEEIKSAIARSSESGRSGKVLIDFSSSISYK